MTMRVLTKTEHSDLFDTHLAEVEVAEDGVITWASAPLEAMFGYAPHGDLEKQPVEVLIPEGLRVAHASTHRPAFWSDPKFSTCLRPATGRRKDGSTFPCDVLLLPRTSEGKRVVVALVFAATATVKSLETAMGNEKPDSRKNE